MYSGQPMQFNPVGTLWENGCVLLARLKDSGEVMVIFLQYWERRIEAERRKEMICCHYNIKLFRCPGAGYTVKMHTASGGAIHIKIHEKQTNHKTSPRVYNLRGHMW